jgi:hypothetical protein
MDELMNALKQLSVWAQIVLGGLVLFVILSFFDWQSVTIGPYSAGETLWHGFGIIVVIIAIVFLVWEILRLLGRAPQIGDFAPSIVSAGTGIVLAVFTIIVFLDWSQFRSWPMYLGTLIAILIGVASVIRAKEEGVDMPKMPAKVSMSGGGGGAAAATTAPPAAPAAPAAPEPPAPADDAGGETSDA